MLAYLKGREFSSDFTKENHVSVHSGMLRSARALSENLAEVGILDSMQSGIFKTQSMSNPIEIQDIIGWKLVLTGININ